jgi:uncharacterized NAD-dependent epimerase/dehydratase family protein
MNGMAGVMEQRAAQWNPTETPLVILAEGCFGESQSKLALGVIRYGQWPIAAVIDSTRAGKTVREVTGIPCDAPIVANLAESLKTLPKALLIGTAPAGGQLPPEWRTVLAEAVRFGLHLVNGLHFFLTREPELMSLATAHHVRLWDVRDPEAYGPGRFEVINLQKKRPNHWKVVTMVGSDCSVGKMHTTLELNTGMQARGASSGFIATGQTGILIAGRGVPLDRVISDFAAGAMEVCIQEEISLREQATPGQPQILFVEGQGALIHPAYSGVTLSLLHGSNPDAMILCHKAGLDAVRNYPHLPIPRNLRPVIEMYEAAASWVRSPDQPKAKVVGISVNTSALPEPEAREHLDWLAAETGLPVTDPIRYGVENLLDALSE